MLPGGSNGASRLRGVGSWDRLLPDHLYPGNAVMSAAQRPAKVLPFQPADSWARRGAEARLLELMTEAREIELWLREARARREEWAVSFAGRQSSLALVKR